MTSVESSPHTGDNLSFPGLHSPGKGKLKTTRNEFKISKHSNDSTDSTWRGYGGRHPTLSSVEFDRQLDKIAVWLEDWNHEQRCHIVEGLLRRSNYNQIQFLFTSLQPMLHRDFMYTAQHRYPSVEFLPVSTHTSRKLKEKLVITHQDNFYRMKSAHFRLDDEVKQHLTDREHIRFPEIQNGVELTKQKSDLTSSTLNSKSVSSSLLPKLSGDSPRKKLRKVQRLSSGGKQIDRWIGDGTKPIYSSVPHIRYIEMPVRRHIQDEPRHSITHQSSLTSALHNRDNSAQTDSVLQLKRKNKHNKLERFAHLDLSSPKLPNEGKVLWYWYTDLWTDVKRNEFLHKFLLKLDPRQHYFISSFLLVRQHRDFLTLLPEKLSLLILSYLSVRELLQASRVCKSWERLANNNELWKAKCENVKVEVPISENPIWKRVFRDNMYLRLNWNEGLCRTVDLKGHTHNVVSVRFDKNRLASGSVDRTIRVWNMKTGQLLQVLKGHSKGIWCLNFFTKNLLLSGGHDGTVKVWNLRTGSCSKTILAHEGPVWGMVRRGHILVTVSQDRTAKLWDIGRCLLLQTLIGHNSALFAVDMSEDGSLVITGSADRSVKIWDAETGKCKKTIWVSQTTSIMAVSYSQGYLACSFGETVCLYKVEGGKLLGTFEEHIKRVESVQLHITDPVKPEGMIVSAGKDGKVIYWDITKEKSIQTFIGHRGDPVNAIYFDELRIASASHDHKIRICDFNI